MPDPIGTSEHAKVIVGMSGGVDSSVAALLLLEQGYRVQGLFMKNWEEDDGTEYCTALADLEDAEQVCLSLGIKLQVANFATEYWDNVFENFLHEYACGRTPNPDVLCNREIKFKQFINYAGELGGDFIATGHYVRTSNTDIGFRLHKGSDPNKDQSYFLQAVPVQQLRRCLFPIGAMDKPAVRALAKKSNFENHRKKDSTGICFIGERRFRDFLQRYLPREPGPIRDNDGVTLGEHIGLPYYTIGQRQGLGIGGIRGLPEAPWYVMAKDNVNNTLIVTQAEHDLQQHWLAVSQLNWLVDDVSFPLTCQAKIRYRQADQACRVSRRVDGMLLVDFAKSQRAVTPGQYVCFYDGDVCLGGGVIEQAGCT